MPCGPLSTMLLSYLKGLGAAMSQRSHLAIITLIQHTMTLAPKLALAMAIKQVHHGTVEEMILIKYFKG